MFCRNKLISVNPKKGSSGIAIAMFTMSSVRFILNPACNETARLFALLF